MGLFLLTQRNFEFVYIPLQSKPDTSEIEFGSISDAPIFSDVNSRKLLSNLCVYLMSYSATGILLTFIQSPSFSPAM